MYRSICVLAASAALLSTSVKAQSGDPGQFAKERAAVYVHALGVDATTAEKMTAVFMEAEAQVAPMRAKCAEIQEQVSASMAPFDEKAESLLSEEQRAKLEAMKKEGKWHPGASCAPAAGAAKSGCGDHGAAKPAGGCCAGKAGH